MILHPENYFVNYHLCFHALLWTRPFNRPLAFSWVQIALLCRTCLCIKSFTWEGIKSFLWLSYIYLQWSISFIYRFDISKETKIKDTNSPLWQTGWFQFLYRQPPLLMKQYSITTCIWCLYMYNEARLIFKSLSYMRSILYSTQATDKQVGDLYSLLYMQRIVKYSRYNDLLSQYNLPIGQELCVFHTNC
jgi:hypothetical protein